MKGAVICVLSLIAANFGVESFDDVPNYTHALLVSWHQLVAIGIYNWLWVKEEK